MPLPRALEAALVEFHFHMRQLVLRNARAEVPDADDDGAILQLHVTQIIFFALAAVLGGVIQNIQKHLPQPRRVAGDLRESRPSSSI